MAFRRPLYVTSGGDLREMDNIQIGQLATVAYRDYMDSPSVTLTNAGGNITSLGSFADTRLRAGTYAVRNDRFPTAEETPNVETVTVTYDNIGQLVNGFDYLSGINSAQKPLYYDDSGNLREMSAQDLMDTIGTYAIDTLAGPISGGDSLYTLRDSNDDPDPLLNNTSDGLFIDPLFRDTRANVAAYTASGIIETPDQPITIQEYWLYRLEPLAMPSYTLPAYYRSATGNVETFSDFVIEGLLGNVVAHMAANVPGSRLRYNVNGNGTTIATFVNTKLNGSGNYQTKFASATDEYFSQEFPNGSVVSTTYNLKVERV